MGFRDRQWVYGLSDMHMKYSWCAEETCGDGKMLGELGKAILPREARGEEK